uniref:Uncharacterized protein n=1 Tax=Bionectria ochroleuca TaxID=29856 RepID=A0A8H7TSD0_BIOOC
MGWRYTGHDRGFDITAGCRAQNGVSVPVSGVESHRGHWCRRARPPDHEPLGLERHEKPRGNKTCAAVMAAQGQVAGDQFSPRWARAEGVPPQGRRCGDCEVGLRGLCKAADRKKLSEGRRIRAEMEHVQGEDALAQGKKEEVFKTEFAVKQEEVE